MLKFDVFGEKVGELAELEKFGKGILLVCKNGCEL
jgi:hypothetical protein